MRPRSGALFLVAFSFAGLLPCESGRAAWEVELGSAGNELVLNVTNSSTRAVHRVTVELETVPDWLHFETQKVNVAELLGPREVESARFLFDVSEKVLLGTEGRVELIVKGGEGSWRKEIGFTVILPTSLPGASALRQNVPNPFRRATLIRYQLCGSAQTTLAIYDLAGRLVRILVTETKPAGFYEVEWDGKNDGDRIVPDGIYFYRLTAGDFRATSKMVVVR